MPVKHLANNDVSDISGDQAMAVVPRSGSPERAIVIQPSEYSLDIMSIWRAMTVAQQEEFLRLACGDIDEKGVASLATFLDYRGGNDRAMILWKTFRTRSVPRAGLMMNFLKARGLNYHDCSVTGVAKMSAAFILDRAVFVKTLSESQAADLFTRAVDYLQNIEDTTEILPLSDVIKLFRKHSLCPNRCKGGCRSCKK
jgi:hypothetical protein